jgi:hypothetical protein
MTHSPRLVSVTSAGVPMVHVVITEDDKIAADAQARDPGVVAFDLDEPFERVVEALMPHRDVPGPGLLAQARRNATERLAFLEAHGALTAEEVADLAGSTARNRRQTAHRWSVKERSVFGVEHHGRTLYPGFQFDPDTGKPLPAVAAALATLPAQLTGWALALWWDTPVPETDGWVTPLEVLHDPARVARLAEDEAARWRHDAART